MVLIPEALWEALKEQFWEEDLPYLLKHKLFRRMLFILSLGLVFTITYAILV